MIICFSGNGNTLYAAKHLAELLGDKVVRLEGDLILNPLKHVLDVSEGEKIVWAFPVYSWGVPPVVRRFIRDCNILGAEGSAHFMLASMGDDAGETAQMWREDIQSRGWQDAGAFGVIMPNTYVCFPGFDIDKDEVARRKLDAMPSRLIEVSEKIKAGFSADDIHKGGLPRVKTDWIYPGFVRTAMNPAKFRVNDKCISCGKCVAACPMDNIILQENAPIGRKAPVWSNHCAMCLACFHVCPTGAISRGRISNGKRRYRLSDYL